MKNDKCIAYFDVLGFSNYIKTDSYAAGSLLFHEQSILRQKIIDAEIQKENGQPEVVELADMHSVSTFEEFLPLSDSVFIVASPTNADRFIEQLSSFLCECFIFNANAYKNSKNPKEPTKIEVLEISTNGTKYINANWFPILFKTGISVGEVIVVDSSLIHKGQYKASNVNVFGKAVVNAVRLAENEHIKGKGPKMYLDTDFISLLNVENQSLVREDNGMKHYLWPAHNTIFSYDAYLMEHGFNNMFIPASRLWKAFQNKSYGSQYFELMQLVIDSFLVLCQRKSKEEGELMKCHILRMIKQENLLASLFSI